MAELPALISFKDCHSGITPFDINRYVDDPIPMNPVVPVEL